MADGGDIVGGTLLSSITFLKLLTSSGLGLVKLGLDSGKCCAERNFSLTKETVEFMLIGVNGLMSIIIVLSRWLDVWTAVFHKF